MAGVDPQFGVSAVRLWLAAGAAALLVVVCIWMLARLRTQAAASLTRAGLVVLGACLGAAVAWAFSPSFSSSSQVLPRDSDSDRRALELRASELSAQALAVGSPLACLDGAAGENVEMACEKALFATPATVASATSYVAARLALLADLVAYSKRGGTDIDNILLPLRHGLETDRFGFVAHALEVRDGCSSQNCKLLELLSDPGRVRANLNGQTLDRYLDHYQTVWAQAAESELTTSAMTPGSGPPRKVLVNADFPSAASIPPVSIMNPEPKGPVVPGAAAAAAANPNPAEPGAAPMRRTRRAPAPSAAAAAAPAAEPVEPVWMPAPAAAAAAPPTAGAPMQLNSALPSPTLANPVATHTQ